MTQQHPITPSIEMVKQWSDRWHSAKDNDFDVVLFVAIEAARWGADQELEACCKWLHWQNLATHPDLIPSLCADRRPKPPSLKEQALAALAEPDGPAVSDDREPASVTDTVTHQLHRRATILLVRKVIDQAVRDTASVHWRVADTGEQLVRASDLVAWADHMEKQMEQIID
jgi:hypothetical protein